MTGLEKIFQYLGSMLVIEAKKIQVDFEPQYLLAFMVNENLCQQVWKLENGLFTPSGIAQKTLTLEGMIEHGGQYVAELTFNIADPITNKITGSITGYVWILTKS